MNLKATPTLPSRTAQEHLCSPDGGCAKLFHSVTKLDSCAYRARARHALLYRPSSGLMGGPNYRALAVPRKAGYGSLLTSGVHPAFNTFIHTASGLY